MTESEFYTLLLTASYNAREFAERYVMQELPIVLRFHVQLNQSYDGSATAEEVLYPEDDGKEVDRISAETVVALLCRDGRCPEWIDVSVEAVGSGFTLLSLFCCGRYTDNRKKMYYDDKGSARSESRVLSYHRTTLRVQSSRFRLPDSGRTAPT